MIEKSIFFHYVHISHSRAVVESLQYRDLKIIKRLEGIPRPRLLQGRRKRVGRVVGIYQPNNLGTKWLVTFLTTGITAGLLLAHLNSSRFRWPVLFVLLSRWLTSNWEAICWVASGAVSDFSLLVNLTLSMQYFLSRKGNKTNNGGAKEIQVLWWIGLSCSLYDFLSVRIL